MLVFRNLLLAPLLDTSHHVLLFGRHCPHFRFPNPRMRRTRLRSALATGRSLEKERRTRFDFLRRRWLRLCFRRRSFPLFAAQLALGYKPSFLAHGAQDTSIAHLLAEALEQALLRFTSP